MQHSGGRGLSVTQQPERSSWLLCLCSWYGVWMPSLRTPGAYWELTFTQQQSYTWNHLRKAFISEAGVGDASRARWSLVTPSCVLDRTDTLISWALVLLALFKYKAGGPLRATLETGSDAVMKMDKSIWALSRVLTPFEKEPTGRGQCSNGSCRSLSLKGCNTYHTFLSPFIQNIKREWDAEEEYDEKKVKCHSIGQLKWMVIVTVCYSLKI